jgi:type IV secretory pathway VirB10-like protein
LKGDVDTHFWARFGQAFLIAGLARVTEPSNTGTPSTGLAPLIAPNAAGQILIDTSRMNLQAAGALQPTITVQRGETFLIMVNHDLALPEFKDGS